MHKLPNDLAKSVMDTEKDQSTPHKKRKITPTTIYSIPSESDETVTVTSCKPMGVLLADVTSLLILLSATAERFSTTGMSIFNKNNNYT